MYTLRYMWGGEERSYHTDEAENVWRFIDDNSTIEPLEILFTETEDATPLRLMNKEEISEHRGVA